LARYSVNILCLCRFRSRVPIALLWLVNREYA